MQNEPIPAPNSQIEFGLGDYTLTPATHGRRWLLLIWACCVLRLLFYACSIPLWEGFDEYSHYARIEYLATEGREPRRDTPVPADVAQTLRTVPMGTHDVGVSIDDYWKGAPPLAEVKAFIYEAHQAPLFYWIFCGLYRMLGGLPLLERVYVLRIACVVLTSVCVPLAFLIARRAGFSVEFALSASAVTASMPILTYNGTHVSNEALGIALLPVVVLLALGGRHAVTLGIAVGAALLTKGHALALLPPIAALLFLKERRKFAAVALACAAILGGWWYVRNLVTGAGLSGEQVLGHLDAVSILSHTVHTNWLRAADFGWTTFVWLGNWSFLVARSWMYHVLGLLAAVSVAGVIRLLWRGNAAFSLLCGFLASFVLALAYFGAANSLASRTSVILGWYIVALSPVIAILFAAGLRAALPKRFQPYAAAIWITAFALVEMFAAHVYMLPYYAGLISHAPDGSLPAFRLTRLTGGEFSLFFQHLAVNKPALLNPAMLTCLWLLFLAATLALIGTAIYLAIRTRSSKRQDRPISGAVTNASGAGQEFSAPNAS